MKLVAFTLVLDGMPWIEKHLSILQATSLDWRWIIVEGASGNTADTSWCQKQEPRLSNDGSHEYLRLIADKEKRITHIYKKSWPNKTEMCNAALQKIAKPCVLMQIDADEIWKPSQLEQIVRLFQDRQSLHSIMFACRYFVGPNLITQGSDCFGDHAYEWLRAWRYTYGQIFISHEPPVLQGDDPFRRMPKDESRKLDLVFSHHAYSEKSQAHYKETFYNYEGLENQWMALQAYGHFPVKLQRFFPFVDDKVVVTRVSL